MTVGQVSSIITLVVREMTFGSIAQLVRAPALQAGGHWFESSCSHHFPLVHGPVVQLVRTPACHAGGRRFEPVLGRHSWVLTSAQYASVAQLVEQRTENPRVVGSIPTGGTMLSSVLDNSAGVAHLVERHLAKVEVAGSSPVARSKTKAPALRMLSFWISSPMKFIFEANWYTRTYHSILCGVAT